MRKLESEDALEKMQELKQNWKEITFHNILLPKLSMIKMTMKTLISFWDS
jgi:hypothetical protein